MEGICERIKKNGEKCTYIAKWKVAFNNEQNYNKLMCGIHSKNMEKSRINNKTYSKKEKISNEYNEEKIEIIIEDEIIQFDNNFFNKFNYEIIKNKRSYISKIKEKNFYIKLYNDTSFDVKKGKYKNYIILKNNYFFNFIEETEKKIQDCIKEKYINFKYEFSTIIKYNNNNKYIILYIDNDFIKCKQYKKGILYIYLNNLCIKKGNYSISCNVTNIY